MYLDVYFHTTHLHVFGRGGQNYSIIVHCSWAELLTKCVSYSANVWLEKHLGITHQIRSPVIPETILSFKLISQRDHSTIETLMKLFERQERTDVESRPRWNQTQQMNSLPVYWTIVCNVMLSSTAHTWFPEKAISKFLLPSRRAKLVKVKIDEVLHAFTPMILISFGRMTNPRSQTKHCHWRSD